MTLNAPDRRQFGAISLLLGNAGLFANGLIGYTHGDSPDSRKAGMERMASSVLYSGGGMIIGRYGSSPVAKQLDRLEGKLAAFMQQNGIPLDAGQMQKADAETRKGWFAKLEGLAYDHPMEFANIYNVVAASGILGSGLLRRRSGGKGEREAGNANILNYMLLLVGTLTCVLIPERTPEQIARRGDSGKLWGKMQEKPLNFAVWPFLGADASYALQSYGEYKTAKEMPHDSRLRPWVFGMSAISAFTMASFMAGDALTGFGSKKPGGDPVQREAAQQQLIDTAAAILANQPAETQAMLARKASEYLAKQQALHMTDFDAGDLSARIMAAIASRQAVGTEAGNNPVPSGNKR